jgi:Ca2+-transporting ATPase
VDLQRARLQRGIGVLLVLRLGFVHLPVMPTLFHTADLSLADWSVAAAGGAVVLPVVTVEKAWRRSRGDSGTGNGMTPPARPAQERMSS